MPDVKITLPADAPQRTRTTPDEYGEGFIPLADAEAAVQATGQHRGTTVEFSDDGLAWVDAWAPTEGHTHPSHARATVLRRYAADDIVTTVVVIRWDEYVPDITDDRYDAWMRMQTMYLGKCAKMSAYRGGYRDVIGNRYEPAEEATRTAPLAITA